jgi:hypothetical protein
VFDEVIVAVVVAVTIGRKPVAAVSAVAIEVPVDEVSLPVAV